MEKNTEVSERIEMLLDKLDVNANVLAKKLGYSRSQTIYDIINKKSNPSYDFFYRFEMSEYSEFISLSWLLTGKGEMLKFTADQGEKIQPEAHVNDTETGLMELIHNNATLVETNKKLTDRLLQMMDDRDKK